MLIISLAHLNVYLCLLHNFYLSNSMPIAYVKEMIHSQIHIR